MGEYRLVKIDFEDYQALCLESVAADITATFVPGAGMVGTSLTYRGEEILVCRGGITGYVEAGKTFGIPLLHPWANRLDDDHYWLGDVAVDLKPTTRWQPAGQNSPLCSRVSPTPAASRSMLVEMANYATYSTFCLLPY